MDLTCRCKPLENYTCVACKVKRGDYRDWIEIEERERARRPFCVVEGCGSWVNANNKLTYGARICMAHYKIFYPVLSA